MLKKRQQQQQQQQKKKTHKLKNSNMQTSCGNLQMFE